MDNLAEYLILKRELKETIRDPFDSDDFDKFLNWFELLIIEGRTYNGNCVQEDAMKLLRMAMDSIDNYNKHHKDGGK